MHKAILGFTVVVLGALLTFTSCVYCEKDLQEPFKYESRGKRDPFIPLIGHEKEKLVSLENITSIEDVNLEGIAIGSGGKNMAILNGQMVKDNDKFGTLQIKKVSRKEVQLSIDGKDYTLKLQEPEKGNGGIE